MKHVLKKTLTSLFFIGLTACSAHEDVNQSRHVEYEKEKVTVFQTREDSISFIAESTGCSQSSDFNLKVEKNTNTEAWLTIIRNKKDHCKRKPFSKTFTVPLMEELKGKKLVITNPKGKSSLLN